MSRDSKLKRKKHKKLFCSIIILFISIVAITQIEDRLFPLIKSAVLNDSSFTHGHHALADEDTIDKEDKPNTEENTGENNKENTGDNTKENTEKTNNIDSNKDTNVEVKEKENVEKGNAEKGNAEKGNAEKGNTEKADPQKESSNNEEKNIIKNPDDILVLVNKKRDLASDYKPTDLVIPNVKFSFEGKDQKKYLRKEAATALEELFKAGEEENIDLCAVSGYRNYARQELLFNNKVKKVGVEAANKLVARPGQSEHQTGLAMDVSSKSANYSLEADFGQTAEGKWLKENAHKYGFIIRYPKEKVDITGYNYEPWHIRYIGKEVAAEIYEKSITLEEYLGFENTSK